MKHYPSNSHQGFSLIELLIVVAIIGILAAIAIPNLLASRRAANEASTLSSVRTLSSSEATYRQTSGSGVTYGTMDQLKSNSLVDDQLANATAPETAKSGYFYAITLPADQSTFVIGATPVTDSYGSRRFSSDTPGVIYHDTNDLTTMPTSVVGSPISN